MTLKGKITALVLTLSMVLLPPAGSWAQMSVKDEKELAEEFLETVHRHFTVIEDPVIHNYINELGGRIVNALPPQPFEYKFHVIKQDSINAFAGPAGNIFVFSGLIEALDTESELAGILAHEIAHVSARHIADLMEKSKRSQMASMAGLIAGILVGMGGASAVGSAISIGSMAAGQSMILAYTRENEMEADFLGRQYMEASDYSLHGLRLALEKIRNREWFGEEEIPTYLKTHPATRDRLANLENILARRPAPPPEDSFAYQRARAAVKGLYGNESRARQYFEQKIEKNGPEPAALYGLALALEKGGRPSEALEKIRQAAELRPRDPYLTVAMGRICFMAGNYEEAEQILSGLENISAHGADAMFYLARSRISRGDCKGAIPVLEKLHSDFPDHAEGLYFLGQCMGEQGSLGKAHYYLGLHAAEKNNFENAEFHFKRAMEKTDDPVLEEKISREAEKLREDKKKHQRRKAREESDNTFFSPGAAKAGQSGKTSW